MSEFKMFIIDNDPDENGERFIVDSWENYQLLIHYLANWTVRKIEENPDDAVMVCFPLLEEGC